MPAMIALRAPLVCSQRTSAMRGSQNKLQMNRGKAVVTMAKKDIHPEFVESAKVICNGEEVLTLGGTQAEYNVDIWSGNHPFYQGDTGMFITDEGRVNRFARRYGNLAIGKIDKGAKDAEKITE